MNENKMSFNKLKNISSNIIIFTCWKNKNDKSKYIVFYSYI